MTVNKVCHHTWDDVVIHVCGRKADHGSWHQCPCGAAQDIPLIDQKRARREPVVPAPVTERIFDDGEGLRYSTHAARRRAEMDVRHHEVRQALRHPEMTYAVEQGRKAHVAGRIVAIAKDGLIITLLWHGAEGRDEQGQAIHAVGPSAPPLTQETMGLGPAPSL